MITGSVNGQTLTVMTPLVAADSVDYLTCAFAFSGDWDGLDKYVHFSKGETSYSAVIDADGNVSEDAHINLAAGVWDVYIHGEMLNDNTFKRLTTNIYRLKVEKTGMQDGDPFPETSPSAAEYYASQAAASASDADAAADRAEAAAESTQGAAEEAERAETAAATAVQKASDASGYATSAASAALAAQAAITHGPRIGTSGTWELWDQQTATYVDTGVEATGEDGEDGHSPYIGINGHWYVWDETDYVDSGVNATGPAGETGDPGVYVGDTEPADPDIMVWVKETGEEITIPTPVAKTSAMTQAVGMDAETGRLYTTPGGGGSGGAVSSVNGQTGDVVLDAEDVGALPDDTVIPDALADLDDDATHRLVTDTEKSTWSAKYAKPSGGIPASDLASSAATTLVLQALTVDTDDWTAEQQQAAQERLGILSVEEVLF